MEAVRIKMFASILVVFALTLIAPAIVRADVPNPDFVDANCSPGEQLVTCNTGFSLYTINPFPKNECISFENNPEYRQIIIKKQLPTSVNPIVISQDHGQEKFCYHPQSFLLKSVMYSERYFLLLLITLLLEVPVFFLFGYRTFANIVKVVLANAISVLGLYVFGMIIPYRNIFILVGGEVLVIMFEAIFLHEVVKNVSYKKAIFGSIVVNLFSATIGGLLIGLILY